MPGSTGRDSWGTYPVEFPRYRAVALIRECLEKVAYTLSDGEPWKTGLVQGHSGTRFRVLRSELAKHLALLNYAADGPLLHRNDDAFIWTANRQQVLLSVFEVRL